MKAHTCPTSIRLFLTKRDHPPRSLNSPWIIEKLSLLPARLQPAKSLVSQPS
uniref:Uncharacterized protein n=1 Tax=Arundo donax TaxID=35708 RepID=A0A0A9HLX5_ARUDO